jgi:coenzyme F420-reducing hydrogenase alpha subunit
MTTRTIRVESLARIEGEGSLTIRFKNRKAEQVEFSVFEPPRLFEGLLRGRGRDEVPDIASRICGLCPAAYQLAACKALERAAEVEVEEASILILRRIVMCAEWIESHALHTFLLHAPDYLGFSDAIEMARLHPDMVRTGLRLKKLGNRLLTAIGGREIHPVNATVGGFFRLPGAAALRALLADLDNGRADAERTLRWMTAFPVPEFGRDYTWLALRAEDEYAMYDGRLVSNRGLDIEACELPDHVREFQVERSTALHALLHGEEYMTGPLARFNLNFEQLCPEARAAAREAGLEPPLLNPFRSLQVRMVEMLHALTSAKALIERYDGSGRSRVPVAASAGKGCAVVEAPRGMLYQRYEVDGDGRIREACIIAPTSQNQASIESDLRVLSERLIDMPHEKATWLAEQAVRNYDPCLSCATHFLQLGE